MGQSSIFEFMYDTYKITKPVRIIELFAGYGSQHLALTYLGVDVKGHKIVEWAVPSIQAYKDLHYGDVNTDRTKELTDDEIINALFEYGISTNYNEPMKKEQIKRKGSKWCRTVYNNIKNTNNLGVVIRDYKTGKLKLKKLSTRECFRAMGVKDDDYDKIAKNQSNTSLYHLAGDSIVVNVLMAIFGQLL